MEKIDLTKINGSIGIIDVDLINRKNHQFPNLALMKISAYMEEKGMNVELTNFEAIDSLFSFDFFILSKVFTDTEIDKNILKRNNVIYGGTGFFYDKAEKLPYEIEHHKPDYTLYKNAIKMVNSNRADFYINHSIGFMTRGCIRQCDFCVNKNYKKVEKHSNLHEFYNEKLKYITLLDDNIIAYKDFYNIWDELKETGKSFTFKQGMDFRLLNEKKIKLITETWQYGRSKGRKGTTFYFAFDNIKDKKQIEKNIKIWNNYVKRSTVTVFYVLTGFDFENKYDYNFYYNDYLTTIERVEILFNNRFYPYIMIHENCKKSPFYEKILLLRNYCNTPMYCTNSSFEQYLIKTNRNNLIKEFNNELSFTYLY